MIPPMAAQCPLCHEMLQDPREACPSCGSKLAAESLKVHARNTGPPPEGYEARASQGDPFEIAPRGERLIDADLGEIAMPARIVASATGVARRGEPEGPLIDLAEVDRIASFGPPPAHWYKAPEYVRRVKARVAVLQGELADAEKRAAQAKGALDDELLVIGLRGIAWMRTTMRPSRGSTLKTLDRISKRESELKAVDPTVVQNAEAARDALVPVLEKIVDARRASPSALEALVQERDRIERAVRIPAKSLDPRIDRARTEFRAACADFARFILDDTANYGEDFTEARAKVTRLREAAEAAEQRCILQRAATDAYDSGAVALGKAVVIGAIAAAVIVVVGAILALV
jgi:hypothetical protein